jgi:branched-chain amino acid transport system ATP-binding protein
MPDAALEIVDLHSWYGESHILQGVTLTVPTGSVVALLGRNGAGKSTLLKAAIGIVRQRKGAVRLFGEDILALPRHKVAAKGIGFVPEERGIFGTLSVDENLLLPPQFNRPLFSIEDIHTLFPNLKERRNSPGLKLSGGEQQMLAIARILRTGAKVLLLDEPTEGLAPVIVERIGEVLSALREKDMTVLLVEQNFEFARSFADHFYLLESGKVIDQFAVAELPSRQASVNAALGL